jgi:hypothetical protein
VLLPIIVCMVFAGGFAQTVEPDGMVVAKSNKRFAEYSVDFIEFAKATSGDEIEYEVAMDLSSTASQTGDYLNEVLTLLNIYDDLSCKEDRDRVRPVIEAELRQFSKSVDLLTTATNVAIAHTKMPGVAAEGSRMRDDLRQAKSTFDSIKLR